MRSILCHISPRLFALAMCVSFAGCGCTTTSEPAAPSPPPIEIAHAWRDALVSNDIEAAMTLVAADFASADWPTRAHLADYLGEASSRGYFASATPLPDSPVETRIGDRVEIYPIAVRAAMGTAVFRLTMAQSGASWEIVSVVMEIY